MTTLEDVVRNDDLDPDVRPQDDLWGHVNGRWASSVTIPDDRAADGSFYHLRDAAEEHVRAIIEEAADGTAEPDTDRYRIGVLYRSFMDVDAVEAAGGLPLQPFLRRIDAVADRGAFVQLLGALAREGIGGPLAVHPQIDRGDPSRYLLHLEQSGLGLPDESYYRLDEHHDMRVAYRGHMRSLLVLAGVVDDAHADRAAEAVMAVETRLASAHWDRAALRDAVKTYNLTTARELQSAFPRGADLFGAMGLEPRHWAEVVAGQPDVVAAVAAALDELDLASWKVWLAWRTVSALAPYLSADFVLEQFDFYGRKLAGIQELRARWKRGVALVESVLGEAVGRLYVERHYPQRARAQMDEMIANLLEAYRQRISTLDWMEQDTRERALAKLAAFTPKVGMPDRWRDYSGMELHHGDLVGNLRAAIAFEFDYEVGRLDRPVDRHEWFMTPQTVNAYYNPSLNEIVFPAAILQPPYFDPDVDPSYNYGAIGAVIGHEIGHGFDDQGSRYDGDGTLRDWWTPADRARFEDRAAALIAQYDVFSPRDLPDRHTVNGALTVGENIGDLGGVAVAYHAYRLLVGDEPVPVEDGLTGDQRFFIGWARGWRIAVREAEAIRRLTIDPHSPPEFRANVVRNVDAFHDAFGTAPGDGLWLDPEDRVSIW